MCLNCGKILCGRYANSHALKHSAAVQQDETSAHHELCMNTLNQSVFCYQCDDFVINETAQLDELRKEFQEGELDEQEPTSSPSSSASSTTSSGRQTVSETASSKASSNDSGWSDDLLLPQSLGRRLRPRKRTISSDGNQEAGGATTATGKEVTSTSTVAPKRTKSSATRRVVGLRNLGNTCFMNSVLQSLSNIQEFSSYFYTLPSMEQIKQEKKKKGASYVSSAFSSLNGGSCLSSRELEEANVVEELRKVLLNLGQGGDGAKAISPECLFLVIWKVVPQFRGHRQHDAHEFLRYMLDRLHTELQQNVFPPVGGAKPLAQGTSNGGSAVTNGDGTGGVGGGSVGMGGYGGSKRNSIVTNVFGGVLQSEVRCLICGMDSKKHDPFLDLSLDIPEKFYSREASSSVNATNGSDGGGGGEKADEKPECHIWDCLSSFTEVEELAETELYYCNSCKCKQKSTKRFWIRRLPNVLCLHIKRFRWSNFFR